MKYKATKKELLEYLAWLQNPTGPYYILYFPGLEIHLPNTTKKKEKKDAPT